jgi:hypothetical protein
MLLSNTHGNSVGRNFGRKAECTSDLRLESRFRREAAVTLIETVISLGVIVIGLGGLFATSAHCYTMLRRSKEIVAVRENMLSRLDALRTLSYSQLAKSSYLSPTFIPAGAAGDATPFGPTTQGLYNLKETITIYALGSHLFSSDADRSNATPDKADEFASQIDQVAPAAPLTFKAASTTKGDWTRQVANALPYIQLTRTGSGAGSTVLVNTSGDLTTYAQLCVDVAYTWTDSKGVGRTQVGSTIISKSGSLR